jgi:hypothetical protein
VTLESSNSSEPSESLTSRPLKSVAADRNCWPTHSSKGIGMTGPSTLLQLTESLITQLALRMWPRSFKSCGTTLSMVVPSIQRIRGSKTKVGERFFRLYTRRDCFTKLLLVF